MKFQLSFAFCNPQCPPRHLSKILLLLVLLVSLSHGSIPVFAEPLLDDLPVTLGLYSNANINTMRMQAISGDWKVRLFFRELATVSAEVLPREKTEYLQQGEDVALSCIAGGILVKFSDGREIDFLGDRRKRDILVNTVEFSDGDLLQSEVPEQSPRIFQGSLRMRFVGGELKVENRIRAGDYLVSTVSELSGSAETEANKAYLVMVRSFIHTPRNTGRHASDTFQFCDDGKHCLPYPGVGGDRILISLLRDKTANEVIWHNAAIPLPRWQDCCGGKISAAKAVYGTDEPIHVEMDDRIPNRGSENCFHSPYFHWTREFPQVEISNFISVAFAGGAERIYLRWDPAKIGQNGRILNILLRGRREKTVSGVEFLDESRDFFGENALPSMRFDLQTMRRTTIYRGMGRGYGVGLCIVGADGISKKNMTYQDILGFYYNGVSIGATPGKVAKPFPEKQATPRRRPRGGS